MRNLFKAISIALVLGLLCLINPSAELVAADETIAVNDQLIVLKINDTNYYTQTIGSDVVNAVKMDTAPVIHLDRTFVPVRFLGNALGVSDSNINWNNTTKTATLQGINKLDLTIGKKAIIVNDQEQTTDVAPMITNSRTMLPARFVAEGLGFNVDWDAENELVIVYQGEKPDVSAIVAKIKGIEQPIIKPEEPKVETKVVELGRNDKGSIQVAGYDIYVTNVGATDPGIWLNMTDLSYPSKDIKVVCTSHPEWNTCNQQMLNGEWKIFNKDVWTNNFQLLKDGYSPTEPKSGDRLTFDVYGKIDGAEVKIAVVTKTLP